MTISGSVFLYLLFVVVFGFRLDPDIAYYTDGLGEPWYFPTPLGRLVGLLGEGGITALGTVAAGVVGWYCRTARAWCVLGLGFPATVYLWTLGVDGIAVALLLLGGYGVVLSFLLHPATVLGFIFRRWYLVALAVITGFCAMLTPYSGMLDVLSWSPLGGLATALLVVPACELAARFGSRRLDVYPYVIAGGLLAMVQGHVQVRYALPAVIVAAAGR